MMIFFIFLLRIEVVFLTPNKNYNEITRKS